VRKLGAAAVGPKHTWIKLLAIGICAFIVFLVFGKGMYTVESPFTLQALEHQVVPAPFDGILEGVEVDLGQEVKKGQVLARLDTDQLQLQLAAVKADKAAAMKEYDKNLRDEKQPEAQIAKAQADKAQAQMDLLEDHIRRATLVAPIAGWVVTGDLKRNVGIAVKTGDVLFEVAPVQNLRAELAVDEREIHEIRTGASGKLATAGHPEERLAFQVETINPIAEITESKNVFKVRVKILDARDWMRPGMEGIAHVDVDRRHYAWIWAHTAVNWIRLKLWI
jgi:multidrug resistance efflux pump